MSFIHPLDLIPRKYVPGRGNFNATVMLVGEAPGQVENSTGWPFVGPAGQELDRYLWWGAGLTRSEVYTTNLYKYWPSHDHKGKQLPPSPEQIREGEAELLMELEVVKPRVIVAIGAFASRWFLGREFKTMKRDHGIPRPWRCGRQTHLDTRQPPSSIPCAFWNDRQDGLPPCAAVVLPVYHPAAGLHSDREQVFIDDDFAQLGKLLRGEIQPFPPADEYPEPEYERIVDSPNNYHGPDGYIGGAEFVASILAGHTVVALDTEGDIAHPWCVTFCVKPGTAYLIRSDQPESLAALDRHINAPGGICTTILHWAAHDIPVLEPHPKIVALRGMGVRITKYAALNADGSLTLRDTMSEAFLDGRLPKALKDLMWRLCGMEGETFEELVGPTEMRISRSYIERVFGRLICTTCYGVGKVPAIGKKGQQLKRLEKCTACTDGLTLPPADREFVFDSDKQDFRWKQPQSIAKWIKRRLGNGDVQGSAEQGEAEEAIEAGVAGGDPGDEAADLEPAAAYFKLRRDWFELAGRNDFDLVESICGRMPRTTLSDVPDQDRVTRYACRDADATLRIAARLEDRLHKLGLLTVREQDAAFIPMLSRMEQIGMRVDREHFKALSANLTQKMDETRVRLSEIVGSRTNPNSPKLAGLLFVDLGLPTIKLTKSGKRPAIDDDVLGALKAKLKKKPDDGLARLSIQVIDCITDYREVQKVKTGYADPIVEHADRDDRIHTTFSYTTAATGRLTSSEPINLQTLPNPDNFPPSCPVEQNWGIQVRSGFVARPGYKLISADYSQIEMVVGAHMTQDPGMLKVFRDGLDLHYYAASMMFDIAYDQVPKALRTQTKPLNFGSFYGLSAIGLQAQFASFPAGAIEKTEAECQELIDRYYRAFPGVMAWKEELWRQGEIDGYVQDLFGRIRWVPGLRSRIRKVRSAAEREAANMPIQSSANGIIRIGSRAIWEKVWPGLHDMGIDAEIITQTHDENVAESQAEWAWLVRDLMVDAMKNAVVLSVPIKVEAKIGDNLYEVK